MDSGAQGLRPWKRRAWAIGIGIAVAVLAAELILRLLLPATYPLPGELFWFREGGSEVAARYTVDEEMGFRPRLGTHKYDEHGTIVNEYQLDKKPDSQRVLFIGDSVTARGHIVSALRARSDDPQIEWWNAGVESFNTTQEVDYYRRYNAGIDPDHVILTFHQNDFGHTPVAFLNEEGHLVAYTADGAEDVNGFLIKHSMLYRLWFASEVPSAIVVDQEAKDRVRDALVELLALLGPDRRLSVILLPSLEPTSQWTEGSVTAYEAAVEIFEELGIRYYDLRAVLEDALADGVQVQETPGDPWHPSTAFAERAADALIRVGLFR